MEIQYRIPETELRTLILNAFKEGIVAGQAVEPGALDDALLFDMVTTKMGLREMEFVMLDV